MKHTVTIECKRIPDHPCLHEYITHHDGIIIGAFVADTLRGAIHATEHPDHVMISIPRIHPTYENIGIGTLLIYEMLKAVEGRIARMRIPPEHKVAVRAARKAGFMDICTHEDTTLLFERLPSRS